MRPLKTGAWSGAVRQETQRYGDCGVDAGNQLDEADHALALEFDGDQDVFLGASARSARDRRSRSRSTRVCRSTSKAAIPHPSGAMPLS